MKNHDKMHDELATKYAVDVESIVGTQGSSTYTAQMTKWSNGEVDIHVKGTYRLLPISTPQGAGYKTAGTTGLPFHKLPKRWFSEMPYGGIGSVYMDTAGAAMTFMQSTVVVESGDDYLFSYSVWANGNATINSKYEIVIKGKWK